MLFDGKTFAAKRREELLSERGALGDVSLGVVMGAHDPVTSSFVRVKERTAAALDVALKRYLIPDDATTDDVQRLVGDAARESGLIVQLPLAPNIDVDAVLASISPEKDVDALSPEMVDRLAVGDTTVVPPVAAAVREILTAENISVAEKRVVVVGKGRLVGAPCAALFNALGAQVTVLDKHDDLTALQHADIVMLGAGSPHLVTPDMVKDNVVVLDAGTSEQAGVVVGDADPRVAEKASFFTPVPGGIGPVAVVEIFGNLFKLAHGTMK